MRRVMTVCLVVDVVITIILLATNKQLAYRSEILYTAYAFTLVFWICAIVEVLLSKALKRMAKIVWAILLLPMPLIATIYFIPLLFVIIELGYLKISKKKLFAPQ